MMDEQATNNGNVDDARRIATWSALATHMTPSIQRVVEFAKRVPGIQTFPRPLIFLLPLPSTRPFTRTLLCEIRRPIVFSKSHVSNGFLFNLLRQLRFPRTEPGRSADPYQNRLLRSLARAREPTHQHAGGHHDAGRRCHTL